MACTSERPFWGVPDRGSCPSWRLGRLEPPRTRVAEPSARGTPAHWLIRRAALRRPSPDLESCGTGAQLAFVLPFTGVGLRAARRSPSFASSRLWTEVVVVPGPRGAHTGTPFPPPCFHCSPPLPPLDLYKHLISPKCCGDNQNSLQCACAYPGPIVLEWKRSVFHFQIRVLMRVWCQPQNCQNSGFLPPPPLNHLLDSNGAWSGGTQTSEVKEPGPNVGLGWKLNK